MNSRIKREETIGLQQVAAFKTALRLAKFFAMSEDFWMNLQLRWDLYKTKSQEAKELKAIRPYRFSEKVVHP